VSPRAQKKAEREAMLRSQFEEKRAERVQKYQVGVVGMGCVLECVHSIVCEAAVVVVQLS
jgi:hypothetical protein